MSHEKIFDLAALQAEKEAAEENREKIACEIKRLQARKQRVIARILTLTSLIERAENARVSEEHKARLAGITIRNPQAKDALENLGLQPEYVEILGRKGLGFRAIYQLQEPRYTYNYLFGVVKDLLQRKDKNLSAEDASQKAMLVIADLQEKLRERDIDLDMQG